MESLALRGANLSKTRRGVEETALGYASRNGHPEVICFLVNHGVDPNQATATPLGSRVSVLIPAMHGGLFIVKLFIQLGADVNKTFDGGKLPLILAIKCPDIFKLLLRAGADPSCRNILDQGLLQFSM